MADTAETIQMARGKLALFGETGIESLLEEAEALLESAMSAEDEKAAANTAIYQISNDEGNNWHDVSKGTYDLHKDSTWPMAARVLYPAADAHPLTPGHPTEERPAEPAVENEDPEQWCRVLAWEEQRADYWQAIAQDNEPSIEQLRESIVGMEVSVDVSTGDHDASHRLFGTVCEAMDHPGGKHDLILLVADAESNGDVPKESAQIIKVPKGYTLVPNEITPEMQRAYFDALDLNMQRVKTDCRFGRFDNNRQAYKAMLSAAPTLPKHPQGFSFVTTDNTKDLLNTLSQATRPKPGEGIPSDVGAVVLSQEFLSGYVKRLERALLPKPLCRDCADSDGRCPNSGELCDPAEQAKELIGALTGLSQPAAAEEA